MQNYYTLLGLEESYAIDLAELQKAYVAAQQRSHPDRLVGKPDAERAKAIQSSMDANEAYETLKNPLSRAEHLLALQGIVVNADEKDTHKPSQALLMEMLELRESLAGAQSEIDIAKQSQDIRAAMKQTEKQIADGFAATDYDNVAQSVIRLRYFGKALEEAMGYHYRLKAQA